MEMNYWAVVAAGLSAFVLGGIWYGPLFGKAWRRATGLTEEVLSAGSPKLIFPLSALLSLIAALVFAIFLGPNPPLDAALGWGVAAGLAWVAASIGIIYLFERRPLAHWLINGGYVTLQFTLYGLILGLWH